MPTVDEIKCELRKLKLLKGTSGFSKSQLQQVLDMAQKKIKYNKNKKK
jgi:ribonuclease PH